MSKRQVIMLLGVVVIFLPFLGLTSTWKSTVNVVCGLLIVMVAYGIRPEVKSGDIGKANTTPFIDHHSNIEPTTVNSLTTPSTTTK